MWSTWHSAGYAVKEGLGSRTRTNTECSQISAGRDENRQTRIRFLIKALQAEGWPAFRQTLQRLVCESLPMRISLNWKGRAEGWVLRVVQSPGSGHQEVWVLPLTLPATSQGYGHRILVFFPSHPVLLIEQFFQVWFTLFLTTYSWGIPEYCPGDNERVV